MPPGWPVPQAFKRSSASAPRTSPIGIRSGRRRSDERTRSESETTPSLVLQRDEIRREALKLAGVLDQHHPVGGFRDLGEKSVGEGCLTGRGAAGDENVAALGDCPPQDRRLSRGHDAGGDIVVEREDRDRGLADSESWRRHDGRQEVPRTALPSRATPPRPVARRHGPQRRHGERRAGRSVRRPPQTAALPYRQARSTAGRSRAARRGSASPRRWSGLRGRRRSPVRARCAASARRERLLLT